MEMGNQIYSRLAAEAEERRANSMWGRINARTPRNSIVHDRYCRCRDCKPMLSAAMTPAYWRLRRRCIIAGLFASWLALIAILAIIAAQI